MIANRIVLCMKWGSLYGSDYVNVLFNACRKNINGQFQFVCLTDDPTGIDKSIQTLPIPDIGCSPEMWMQGAWPKLSVFMENLYDLKGRVLFIDMDTVVWGSLDKFFEYSGSFVGIDTGINWRPNRLNGGANALLGTGVFAFNMGEQSQVLSRFQCDSDAAFKKFGIEQVWVQKNVQNISYWPQGWVISFKRWLRRPIGVDLFLEPKKPTPETGLIAFHGIPRPIELVRSKGSRWDQFPHMGHGTVGWMRDYWLENGGKVDLL